jgi:hypothetical protein
MEAVRGQKRHEGVDLLEKVFNKSCSTTSKPPYRIQSDLSYNLRLESYDFWGHRGHSSIAVTATVVVNTYEFREAEDPSTN